MTTVCRRSRRWGTLALALLACAALAACGGGGHKTASHALGGSSSASGSSSVTRSAPSPIATAAATLSEFDGPQQLRISIYDLRRDGPFAVLDFGITCLTPSTGCGLSGNFAPAGSARGPVVGDTGQDVYEPSGVFLVDPLGENAYHPVRDAERRPFTTTFASHDTLHDSLTHLEWVRYPAPPASVGSIDVVFPDGGPQFTRVPISSGAAPTAGGNLSADPPAAFSQAPTSPNTSGLTLPVSNLLSTVGNLTGSDTESPTQASLTLRSDVLFQFAKANLTPAARTILKAAAAQIKSRARGTVQVTGYTDSIGSDAVNIPLSLARARAVLGALQPLTPGVGYSAAGKGSADPIAPNTKLDGTDNPAGRALNRRVTIAFAAKAPAKPTPPPQTAGSLGTQPQASTNGTATFTVNHNSTYQATADSLFHDGNLLALRITISCVSSQAPASSNNTCFTENELGGTPTVPPQQPAQNEYLTFSGFYLEDPGTGTIYVPLRDSYTNPLTGYISDTNIPINNSYSAWAYYPAPPSSVNSLTLITPQGTARIANVPIASSPPAP